MGLFELNQVFPVATVLVLALFLGRGACDSICPDGITNITGSSGSLVYPSSGDYGVNETKCWKIEVPEGYYTVGYIYRRYEIEPCDDCKCDYLQTSSSYNALHLTTKKCGRYSAEYLEYLRLARGPKAGSSGRNKRTLYFRFVSDDNVHHKGFNLTFVAGSVSGGLETYLNASDDETITFGTPKVGIENYPRSYAQQWFLIVPEGRQIEINFDTFELEQSENCKNDYVEIREASISLYDPRGMSGSFEPILSKRLCGSTKPRAIQSAGNMVWVQSEVTATLLLCTRDSRLLLKQVREDCPSATH
ncbi:hypothetical protein OS493_025966 [Desmophyllum pertusum]|uniref:CUB domain-containing protein n=1 Tax=Desmophyllum pertusum TaxID=174260 RepID=A0A9W9YL04_9CNID|nr:hypothetical protein OS493_025966 [Desmophyllum pertusum]